MHKIKINKSTIHRSTATVTIFHFMIMQISLANLFVVVVCRIRNKKKINSSRQQHMRARRLLFHAQRANMLMLLIIHSFIGV